MVELAPGARHTLSMPLARYGEPRCSLDGVSCESRLGVPAGSYTVAVSWYEALYPNTGTGTGERHIASAPCQLPGQSQVLVPIQ